ncbi:MAG: amino acid permease [Kordiimonadaceae bacterium]|nr:amino acid permease [Kordiimonadaceae bacterium]
MSAVTPKLKRDIGYLVASFLVLNGIIGAGIFALPGELADQAGLYGPWLILLCGVLIISVAWTFAAIASYFKTSGGPVTYASAAFGPAAGFQVGWFLYVGRGTSLAANTNVLFNYIAYFWDGVDSDISKVVLFIIIIGGLTVVNIMGLKGAMKAISLFSLMKAIPILVLILIGLPYVSPAGILPGDFPVIDDMGTLVLLILYAFVGFECVLFTSGETKEPKKTLPRALFTTVVAITVVYFLIQLIYVNTVTEVSKDTPLIELGRILFGEYGATIIIVTALCSIMGTATSILLTAPRLTFSMAEQGMLPSWFSVVHEKYNTPANSVLFLGAIGLFLGITGTFVYLALASALARIIAYIICICSLPAIRRQADPETLKDALKLPGGYLIPALGLLVCAVAVVISPLQSWLYLSGFIILGGGLYFINSRLKKGQS